MKRSILGMMIAVAALSLVIGCTKGYESQKTVEDLKITLSVAKYPLIKGDNVISVAVADTTGKAVTDAAVNVRYYMPPMPGMAPMDYNAQGVLKGSAYAISANIPMEGGWKVEVSVVRPGKPAVLATFNLDAR